MRLDLSGSAKGEIIDQVCQLLNRWNFKNYLVEIGGEIRAHGRGKKGNNGWIVGLESWRIWSGPIRIDSSSRLCSSHLRYLPTKKNKS